MLIHKDPCLEDLSVYSFVDWGEHSHVLSESYIPCIGIDHC